MSLAERFAHALWRISNATSIGRTRTEDIARVERNGGIPREREERLGAVVTRLEKVASDLERTLA